MANHDLTNTAKKIALSAPLSGISPKTMAAVVLMATMAILWGRVLLRGRSGPATAQAQEAAAVPQQTMETVQTPQMQFEPVELPFVAGRNDRLGADLFSKQRWTAFDFEDAVQGPVEIAVDAKTEEKMHLANLDAIAKETVLEAVIRTADGSGMQAFIGGKVLTVGQVLTVKRQMQVYDLLVSEISPREAVLTWNAYSIRLKITESQEQ
ncbi:MAG: hypothetical protein LLF76_09380 [Planctomycetaceae bacterium]|nr:hypothetical protein [Planctomycetaceae bacterium]